MGLLNFAQSLLPSLSAAGRVEHNNQETEKMELTNIVRRRSWVMAALVALSLVAGGVAGSWVTVGRGGSPLGPRQAVPMYIATGAPRADEHASPLTTFAPIVKATAAAVVNISSSKIVRSRPSWF